MTWLKIGDEFLEDETLGALQDRTFRIHVKGLVYCARNNTDGHVSARGVKVLQALLGPPVKRHVEELVSAQLWRPVTTPESISDGTVFTDGYSIKNFLKYNPSRREVAEEREKNRKRQKEWREKGKAAADAVSNGDGNALRNGTPTRPDPTRPDRIENPDGFSTLIEHWLEHAPPLIAHKAESPAVVKARKLVAEAVAAHGVDDVKAAITAYAEVLVSPDHWLDHRWTLHLFFKQANAFPMFLPEANPLANYRRRSTFQHRDRGVSFEDILKGGNTDGASVESRAQIGFGA